MNLFNFVKNNVSITELISSYTTLKRAGGYLKGICPFHHEKTASFTVSPHREIFYCFGCHAHGDVISFIATIERCSQLEAAYFLVDRFNLEPPQSLTKLERDAVSNHQEKKRYWQLMQLVADWWNSHLHESQQARAYLKNRRIGDESCARFKLGYFPEGDLYIKQLISYTQAHTFLLQDLLQAGILMQNDGGLYSPFQDRIIFPIRDHLGRYCAFGGRIFKDHDERAKYYNLKETPYFQKGSLLFNSDLARPAMQKQGIVVLVEGYIDCIALVQQGYEHTVATLGTACSLEQLKTLSRHAQTLYVMYDGDQAGKQAILRITQLCWQVNLDLRVAELPAGQDPASFITAGGSIATALERSLDIFLFFIKVQGQSFGQQGLQKKLQAADQILAMISAVPDTLKRDLLLQAASQALDIPFSTLKSNLHNHVGKQITEDISAQQPGNSLQTGPEQAGQAELGLLEDLPFFEKKLFSVIINNVYQLRADQQDLLDYFSTPLRDIMRKLQERLKGIPGLTFGEFYQELAESERRVVGLLSIFFPDCINPEQELDQLAGQLRRHGWRQATIRLRQQLAQAQKDGNKHEVERLLHAFQELKTGLVNQKILK
jgi:DNA primase